MEINKLFELYNDGLFATTELLTRIAGLIAKTYNEETNDDIGDETMTNPETCR